MLQFLQVVQVMCKYALWTYAAAILDQALEG